MMNGDCVLRAITDDGAFRVITARTTESVRAALAAQDARGSTARWFGDLVTGAVLFRETMAPNLRVQGILQGARKTGSMVVDSHPDGKVRGLVQRPPGNGEIAFGDGAILQMMRTLPRGRFNTGQVEVPSSGGVSAALMNYMQTSEQVVSMIAVGTVFEGAEVKAAGGYIVQLLPEVAEGPLMVMTERLRDYEVIDDVLRETGADPTRLLDEILHGMPFTRLAESAVGYGCQCSEVRLLASLATLPRHEIEEFVREGAALEISCDYCRREYRIAPEQLRGLLDAS